jgi:D-alanyl-D-alanine carboxypeptidase
VPVVTTLRASAPITALIAALGCSSATIAAAANANPEAALLIEFDTGKVLHAENATVPWYPASLTKLMTAYVTLQAVKDGRLTLDSLVTVSARAAAQLPTKMGFRPGNQVTVDNALKMLMVKSANDMAVLLAEGVSGSVEKFAGEMNRTSSKLGMTQSSWVNPNGLPADEQISSARDLALLARALLHDFPEYEFYWQIPAIKLGKRIMRNHNSLIGRYDGADGMKTGFICSSGFNLVASATRGGKRLIAVVLGSPSSPYRGAKAAGLIERGFYRGPLAWLAPSLGSVESLQPVNAAPPDLREAMCGKHRKRPAAEQADDGTGDDIENSLTLTNLPSISGRPSALVKDRQAVYNPVVVFVGPSKKPAETQFAATRAKLAKFGKGGNDPAAKEAVSADTNTGPGVVEARNPSWLSFAQPVKAETPPLTAVPNGKPAYQLAAVPLPRPRPKLLAKSKQ